ncbi:CLN3 domain protein [Metarhizium robertsii]|uniref:Protein BTN n=2 Tax=Metarhizium robertsii TaxID=568076 RepID=E9EZJ9_METRA|nr:Batten's disease protein Cln3 [Metarhizium robertsii ARSEF 23]EFY99390.1 Batten's disease protein Cln3 [Metarhizium robertsii ARSEF 23]EXV04575.1 CLN3 domain protein [Metarhizium robertsii]
MYSRMSRDVADIHNPSFFLAATRHPRSRDPRSRPCLHIHHNDRPQHAIVFVGAAPHARAPRLIMGNVSLQNVVPAPTPGYQGSHRLLAIRCAAPDFSMPLSATDLVTAATNMTCDATGLINNVLYVIILSAAQDLVGSSIPKGVVLLADVMPSFFTKLIAPYFIHHIPYRVRVLVFITLSAVGMLMVALTPPSKSVLVKMVGVVLASLSSGGGELSFLGLSHYYGHISLVGWGSGTGAAGLVGAGLYVVLTEWWRFSVRDSLLFSASLPAVMFVSFFFILPLDPLRKSLQQEDYETVPDQDLTEEDVEDMPQGAASSALLAPGPSNVHAAYSLHSPEGSSSFRNNLRRAKSLFIPYMAPLLLVYIAEYIINQGVSPTLLFPVESSPFEEYRGFYPFYGFLYQLGVFISRSSTPFIRIHTLYVPSVLQVGNMVLLILQSLFFFIPSVYIVFIIIFWEGLLGGAVYVNCFAEIMENIPEEEREFSLSATTVSDSGGICVAAFVSILLEPSLCAYQLAHGRDWCRRIEAQRS